MLGPMNHSSDIHLVDGQEQRDSEALAVGSKQPTYLSIVLPSDHGNAPEDAGSVDNSSVDQQMPKRRKVSYDQQSISPDAISAPPRYQAPPGHASFLSDTIDLDSGIGAKYSLRTRRDKPAVSIPAYETRRSTRATRSGTDSLRDESPPPRLSRDSDRAYHAKIESMEGHRPETRGIRKSYAFVSDEEEFDIYLPASRPTSSRSRPAADSNRPTSAESVATRRSTRSGSHQPNDENGTDHREGSAPVERPTRPSRNNRRVSDGSDYEETKLEAEEDNGVADGSDVGPIGTNPAETQQTAKSPYPKLSLKFRRSSNEENTINPELLPNETSDENVDIDEEVEPPRKSKSGKRITSDDDEDDEEFADNPQDDDFELDEDEAEGPEDDDYFEDGTRRDRYRSHRSSRLVLSHRREPHSDEIGRTSRSRKPVGEGGYSVPSRVAAIANSTDAADKEEQERKKEAAKSEREKRAAKRQKELWGDDFWEVGAETEDDMDSIGRPRRRLRPRGEKVDYSRQMHPGQGWVGQPLEVLKTERATGRLNGRNGGSFGRYNGAGNGGGGRNREDRPFTYKPGRYGRETNAFDSSDDDMNLTGSTPRGRGKGGRPEAGRPVRRDNNIEPMNIMEILRAQEQSIMKDLPEEERKKYEKNSRLFRTNGGKDLADTDPVATSTVNFDSIGGLEDHIRSLKEMVVMPLLYPEIFAGFQISAPRGVLFHGPPGTGKTLMARALASSCSTSTQKVAFFMRKGADVLSKWVGESERQLRLLFEEAKTYQPSIIFFDEIDGLAPVRSSKQDQIHASIVSTLLALMDGLDSRGQVVVIGATNRIDAIDPALRRPGRFDRELYFPLPSEPARKKIISITTSKWTPPIGEKLLDDLAKSTRGYCGADVRSLCTEAALNAVQRSFPEIYESSHKLEIDTKDIVVTAEDFAKSMKRIIPSTQRTSTVYSNPIPQHLRPLVQAPYADIIKSLDVLYPLLKQVAEASVTGFMAEAADGLPSSAPVSFIPSNYLSYAFSFQPRLLICGEAGMGQKILGPAALERLEVQNVYIQSLDLSTLLNDSSRSVDAAIIQLFHEMKRHRPAVLYIPDIDIWWESLSDVAKFVFVSLTERDPMNPVMVLATCEAQFDALPPELKGLIQGRFGSSSGIEGWKRVIVAQKPDKDARKQFFEELVSSVRKPATSTHSTGPQRTRKEPLKRATSPPPRELTEEETRALFEHDETLRRQLRLELRFIVTDIKRNKKFNDFLRPVDPDLFPDYYEVVAHPMDLETLLWNINNRRYSVLDEFIDDFECIIRSAEEYNQPDSAIVAKAYDLMDTFMSYITTLKTSEPQFVWELEQSALRCRLVNQQRRAKGLSLLGRERETIPWRRRGQRETVQDREEDEEESRKEGQKESEGHMETPPRTAMVGEEEGVAPSSASSKRNVRRVIDDSDNEEEVEGTSSVIGASSASVQSQTASKNGVTEMKDEADKGDAMDTETGGSLTRDEVKEGAEAPVDAMVEEPRETIVQADDEDVEEDPLQKIFDLEEDVSVNAINADFIHTQDENILEVAIVVEEPQRELVVDEAALTAFARDLVDRTHGWSVSDLEALGVALSNVVLRHVNEWDREAMIQDLNGILGEAEKVWGKRDGM